MRIQQSETEYKQAKEIHVFFPSRVEILSCQTDPKINPKLIQKEGKNEEKIIQILGFPLAPVALTCRLSAVQNQN